MNLDRLKENLIDAKCSEKDREEIERMIMSGRQSEALHKIKMFRCSKIEEMHDCCKQIDCLDYLIRQMNKEIVKR